MRSGIAQARTLVVIAFASFSALLAVIGIYGVMAFVVEKRRHEIGLRMALGAVRGRVLGEVLRQGAVLIAAGVVVGLAGAIVASRALSAMLFGVEEAVQVPTYAAVAALLAAAGLLACYVPAHRASRVCPMAAMRQD